MRHSGHDPETRGGTAPDGRKLKATIHRVSAAHAIGGEVRLYDRLFTVENPGDDAEGRDFTAFLNPASLEVISACRLEPSLASSKPGDRFQFERLGYFSVDPDSAPGTLDFNRTVTLRDQWAKIEGRPPATPNRGRSVYLRGFSVSSTRRIRPSVVTNR